VSVVDALQTLHDRVAAAPLRVDDLDLADSALRLLPASGRSTSR
jgi:hypothetical protein